MHRLSTGHSDVTGDDFGTIYANAIGGNHRESPLGIADVVMNGSAWSVKTVKKEKPFGQTKVRLISGRNSPNYSQGIENPHKDLNATGRAVLEVWNARVSEALNEYNGLRIAVLIRDMSKREFVLFEEDATHFDINKYEWTKNNRDNFEGKDRNTGKHKFTWQPHGSQFTIIRYVPASAIKFRINQFPPTITCENVLKAIGYEDSWIEILQV